MSEKNLGKALLRGEEPIDLQALTDRVLRRDRRRMWLLGLVCVFAWLMVVMIPWATILPMMAKVGQYQAQINSNSPGTTSEQQNQLLRTAEIVKEGTITTFIDSIASMLVAALCTVSLVILSRRATLRQLNARLAEISAQVKLLAKDSR